MTALGPAPRNVNPVAITYRDALARMQREQRKFQSSLNTILTGGQTGVVGVGIFGRRFGVVRRYSTPQAYINATNQLISQNFIRMALALEVEVDKLIDRTWKRLEQSM